MPKKNEFSYSFSKKIMQKVAEHIDDPIFQRDTEFWKKVALSLSNESETGETFDWSVLRNYYKRSLILKLTRQNFDIPVSIINRLIYPYLRKLFSVTIIFTRCDRISKISESPQQVADHRLFIKYMMSGEFDEKVVNVFRKYHSKKNRTRISINVENPGYALTEDLKKVLLQMETNRTHNLNSKKDKQLKKLAEPAVWMGKEVQANTASPLILDGAEVEIMNVTQEEPNTILPNVSESSDHVLNGLNEDDFNLNTQEYDAIIKESLEPNLIPPAANNLLLNSYENEDVLPKDDNVSGHLIPVVDTQLCNVKVLLHDVLAPTIPNRIIQPPSALKIQKEIIKPSDSSSSPEKASLKHSTQKLQGESVSLDIYLISDSLLLSPNTVQFICGDSPDREILGKVDTNEGGTTTEVTQKDESATEEESELDEDELAKLESICDESSSEGEATEWKVSKKIKIEKESLEVPLPERDSAVEASTTDSPMNDENMMVAEDDDKAEGHQEIICGDTPNREILEKEDTNKEGSPASQKDDSATEVESEWDEDELAKLESICDESSSEEETTEWEVSKEVKIEEDLLELSLPERNSAIDAPTTEISTRNEPTVAEQWEHLSKMKVPGPGPGEPYRQDGTACSSF